ncbi:MAG: ankyrin repeat domain-containing protein [Spirochaetales bacterium]|nr:ankyrin repeat domain-containing protein [Spirochaetales bacterium]
MVEKLSPLMLSICLIAGLSSCATTDDTLHEAVIEGDSSALVTLVAQEEANLDATDKKGQTPLHLASIAGDLMAVAALLNADAAIDLPDKEGRTALHYGVLSMNPDLVAMLLAAGASPYSEDKKGITPVQLAQEGDESMAQIIASSLNLPNS